MNKAYDQSQGEIILNSVKEDNIQHAVQALIKDVEVNPVNEMRLYVFEEMMKLLDNVPSQFEAIAVARLALLGSVTGMVEQNSSLISLVQNVCEKFGVTVKVTQVNGANVYEKDLPIIANAQYDFKTLQMGMIALIAKMNGYVAEAQAATKQLENAENTILALKTESSRLNTRVKDFLNVPPPPTVEKPYRLARSYVKDGKQLFSYVTKDETNGYKSTRNLSKALQWDDVTKATERLVHLTQNATEYPISNIWEFSVISIHAMNNHASKVETELQLALSQARTRAEKNLGVKK